MVLDCCLISYGVCCLFDSHICQQIMAKKPAASQPPPPLSLPSNSPLRTGSSGEVSAAGKSPAKPAAKQAAKPAAKSKKKAVDRSLATLLLGSPSTSPTTGLRRRVKSVAEGYLLRQFRSAFDIRKIALKSGRLQMPADAELGSRRLAICCPKAGIKLLTSYLLLARVL